MKYRVIFRERVDQQGEVSDNPPSFLEPELDDETVIDAVLVSRNDPQGLHVTEDLEEDDSFLSVGTEVWEYDVVDGKDQDFKDALLNSGMVIEYELIDSSD